MEENPSSKILEGDFIESKTADWGNQSDMIKPTTAGSYVQMINLETEDSNNQPNSIKLETEDFNLQSNLTQFETANSNLQANSNHMENEDSNHQSNLIHFKTANLQTNAINLEMEDSILQSNLINLEMEDSNLQSKLADIETEDSNLQSKFADIETENSNLQSKLADIETENSNLLPMLADRLETEDSHLQSNLFNLVAEDSNLRADFINSETADANLQADSKQLAILIYDFLLKDQQRRRDRLTTASRRAILRAAECLSGVYRIRFADYVFRSPRLDLLEIFDQDSRPVPVKHRILARSYKEAGNRSIAAGNYGQAELDYTRAVILDNKNAIHYCNRAASKVLRGNFLEAKDDCKAALELDPQYVKAHSILGLVYAAVGNRSKATHCYRTALRIEPDNKVCLENLETISKSLRSASLKALKPRNWVQCLVCGAGAKKKKMVVGEAENGDSRRLRKKKKNMAIEVLD